MNNECYKRYTHKHTLAKLTSSVSHKNTEETENENHEDVPLSLRLYTRASSSFAQTTRDRCVICDQKSYKKDVTLNCMGEDRASLFFKATRHLKDEVYCRTSILESPAAITAAKLLYHANCLRIYERRYENCIEQEKKSIKKSEDSKSCVIDVIKSLESRLYLNEIFSLQQVNDLIKTNYSFTVKNSNIKKHLIEYFGEDISFKYAKQKNKSQLFYYSKVKRDIEKSYNNNAVVECAEILKNSIKETDFKLEDSFCDAHDLTEAWKNLKIPQPFLEFLSKFFEVDQNEIVSQQIDSSFSKRGYIKAIKLKSLFQIMYFIKNNGHKKTPFHVFLSTFIYHTTRSKQTLNELNRFGLSISHDEMLRIKVRLASYSVKCNENSIPLPSHFNRKSYVTAAFDNFDYNEATTSGLHSTHDTVCVVFQNDDNEVLRKPKITDAGIDKRLRSFACLLQCQKVKDFIKNTDIIKLPEDYVISDENRIPKIEDFEKILHVNDLIWILARLNFSDSNDICISNENQQVPWWSSFNSATANPNCVTQRVGFLPILPAPITDFATVYTSLCNFMDLLNQLDQEFLPVTCDEGVYKIARVIKLQREKEFEKIVLCIGQFHLIKILQACIGKYLKNSGIENIFVEAGLFGVSVIDQIFSGNHYARCIKAFTYLFETLRRLQIKEFLSRERQEKYESAIISIILLQGNFSEKNVDDCKLTFEQLKSSIEPFLKDFNDFILMRSNESELYKYWNNVAILISLMLDLVRADRTANWQLHLETVEKCIPIFHCLDRINYTRWCSLYLEDMLLLKNKAPEVYDQFCKGRFVVNRSLVPFTSVATDQALEQSINKFAKSSGGIIGITSNKEATTTWELTFHELLSIASSFKDIALLFADNEFFNHHEFSLSKTITSEEAVQQMMGFLSQEKYNPFLPGSHKLRNICTNELVQTDVAKEILSIFDKGLDLHKIYKKERFVDKSKNISDTISKINFPDFKTVKNQDDKTIVRKKKKTNVGEIQRIVALANERNYPLELLLKYELSEENYLFDEDGFFKKETDKSSLVRELEENVLRNTRVHMEKSDFSTVLLIDVMLVMRKLSWTKSTKFNDVAINFCEFVNHKASLHNTKRIDFVFDSYFRNSIKSSEHVRRKSSESLILYHDLSGETPLPKQIDKFWSSSENKILVQKFLRNFILNSSEIFNNRQLILSNINDTPCASNWDIDIDLLQRPDIEEADIKLMLHMKHAIDQGCVNAYLISSDTDVFVLSMYFFNQFTQNGLKVYCTHI